MGRRNKLPLFENIEITDIAAEGKALARIDNMVLFVQGLVPGDVADIQINRKRKNYMEGIVVKLRKQSPIRKSPVCDHFGVCGGCKWQQLPYKNQLLYKQKQVEDNLQRIAKVNFPEISPILGSAAEYEYRNKLEFTFSSTRWLSEKEIQSNAIIKDRRALGFHIPGKFDRVLDIGKCYLQHDFSNSIRNCVKDFTLQHDYPYFDQRNNNGLMRNLIIRNTILGEWMVVVVFYLADDSVINKLLEHIKINFPEITSLMYVINPKVNDTIHDLEVKTYHGRDHIFEELNGLKFKIGPKSFFQTNTCQAKELYRITREYAALTGDEIVYDLYTGTGTIACYIAKDCRKVIGIENIDAAVEDAKINADLNNIENTWFITGDMKDVLDETFIEEHGSPDVIIADPPRAGMHADVVNAIKLARPDRIIYVSCNPATQARDIQVLSENYKVTAIQPVDMFPQTHHVENVVRLDLISMKFF